MQFVGMAYQFWLDELSLSANNTQLNYKRYLQKYMDYVGMGAEDLYLWQKGLLEDGDNRTNRGVAARADMLGCPLGGVSITPLLVGYRFDMGGLSAC